MSVRYRVELADLRAHQFRVTLSVARPATNQRLSLPVWAPGSYMVRDFSRHVSGLQARQGEQALEVEPLDKASWQVRCTGRVTLVVSWLVYAQDRTVRGAYLDAARGFFNGSSMFLRAHGHEHLSHRLEMGPLPAGWNVATSLLSAGRRRYEAANYAELIDHPFELGRFWHGDFVAGGVPHEVVVTGALPSFDGQRLLDDTRRICEQHLRFWQGEPGHGHLPASPPFGRYVFLIQAAQDGHGGLEHRDSTALLVARRDLPRDPMEGLPDGYVSVLSLISHEYFHAWNVKRLRPADLQPIDLSQENYTRMLWFFEGFTSYFDDLMLLRAGLIDLERYLRLVSRNLNAVANSPGRQIQSLAQASFDAWIKLYRPDENTPNATVNYYQKGALVALAFDLRLRQSGGSLDQVMRLLWQRTVGAASGVADIDEADIAEAMDAVAGRSFADERSAWVHGTVDPPVAELLAELGVSVRRERAGLAAALGIRLSEGPVSGIQVTAVLTGGAAERAGLCAGDELLAVDGWRIRRLDDAQAWIGPELTFELLVARDQRILGLRVVSQPAIAASHNVQLQVLPKLSRGEAARRRGWLDG